MPRPSPRALLCAALFLGCRTADPAPPRAEVAVSNAAPTPEEQSELAAEAIRCIEEGRYARAGELLDQLCLADLMARAGASLAAGSPEDALTAIDDALRLDPFGSEPRLLKADASLRLAESKIQAGGGSAGLIEGALSDALEYYRGAGDSAHALFGASRAAFLLGRTEEALELARRARELGSGDEPELLALGLTPERIFAEEVYAAYASARSDEGTADGSTGRGSAEAAALFRESEDALARLLGREGDDPWAWGRLSDLYEWEGRLAEAQGALERGLKRAPEDAGLLERLARVSRSLAGAAATVAAFEAHVAAHPAAAAGRWQLAVARFQLALEGYKQTPRVLDPPGFARAEEEFRTARERAPELAQQALGYEVVCRLARGWCAFHGGHGGDLERARREFLSTNELFERGIEWSLPGELESGIQGLFFVADTYNARGDNLAAGEVFETLHGLQPDEALWANNAGFFLRDAAVDLEREGRRLCRAARGATDNAEALAELRALAGVEREPPGSPGERAAFARAADERFERARVIMERSHGAYRPAAELAPEDVRVVNDVALVLVYYLHRDLDLAEELLLRCVELGGPQVEAKREALRVEESPERASQLETELALLVEAWGDAHQNLGVLEWEHRRNAEAARAWFEKAVAIGPDRPQVTNFYLPRLRGESVPGAPDEVLDWARPCR